MADANDLPQTDSGIPIKRLYDAADLDGWDPATQLGAPGKPPYTRGVYGSMYTGRLWTMRQYSGFGNAEATNERFKFLLERRADRAVVCVRPADADGLRLRRRSRRG